MMNDFLPRPIGLRLDQCLRTMLAVVISGARQTEKSTLAGPLVSRERRFISS